jgi:hypothetical protein
MILLKQRHNVINLDKCASFFVKRNEIQFYNIMTTEIERYDFFKFGDTDVAEEVFKEILNVIRQNSFKTDYIIDVDKLEEEITNKLKEKENA